MSKCVEKGGCLWHCMQIVRWFPVAIVAAAVGWGYYAFVFQLCFNAVQNLWQRILYLIVFHILLVLFLLSYYRTIFARLRTPAKEFYLEEEDLSEIHAAYSAGDFPKAQAILRRIASIRRIPVQTRGYDGGIRMCDKCKCIKPDRAHHCSVCGQCVLKFDHHCPWVNNCVNFHNYKFFLLFLGYAFAFCMFVFFVDLPYFIEFWKSDFRGTNVGGGKFHLLFLEFVSGMFAISVSCLFFYHLYLVSKNRSTIESFTAPTLVDGTKDKNAFNHGVRANFREVFGPSIWKGILPIYTSCGDGMEFTVRDGAMCLGVTVAGHQGYGNHTTTTTRSDSGPYDSASVGDRTTNTRTGSSNSYHGSASNGYSTHTAGTGYGNGRPTGQHQQQHRFHPEVAPLNQYGPALQQQQRVYRYHNGKGNEALEMV